jgi:hypothetical protein
LKLLISTSFILIFTTLIQLCPAPFIPVIIAAAEAAAAIGADVGSASAAAFADAAADAGIDSEAIAASITWKTTDPSSFAEITSALTNGDGDAAETDLITAVSNNEISESQFNALVASLRQFTGGVIDHHYKRSFQLKTYHPPAGSKRCLEWTQKGLLLFENIHVGILCLLWAPKFPCYGAKVEATSMDKRWPVWSFPRKEVKAVN